MEVLLKSAVKPVSGRGFITGIFWPPSEVAVLTCVLKKQIIVKFSSKLKQNISIVNASLTRKSPFCYIRAEVGVCNCEKKKC